MTWGLSGLDPAQARRLAAVFTSMLLRDEGTKHLKLRQKQPQSRSERKDSLHFRTRAPSIEGIQRLRIWPPCTTKARWNNPAPKGSRLPPPDTTDPADKIFTSSQAAKRLGIPLSTLRRLVRDGTLWAVRMKNGEVGLTESEVQRFLDRFEKPAQKGE